MSDLGNIISLTEDEKELYSKLDFKYFLDKQIILESISEENVKLIYKGYLATKIKIQIDTSKNKGQYHYFIEGWIRKMHSGGMLATHFNLSEARKFTIIRYEEYGESWAYFEAWSKQERRKRRRKLVWKRIVDFGAILGFLLAAIKLLEVFTQSSTGKN